MEPFNFVPINLEALVTSRHLIYFLCQHSLDTIEKILYDRTSVTVRLRVARSSATLCQCLALVACWQGVWLASRRIPGPTDFATQKCLDTIFSSASGVYFPPHLTQIEMPGLLHTVVQRSVGVNNDMVSAVSCNADLYIQHVTGTPEPKTILYTCSFPSNLWNRIL